MRYLSTTVEVEAVPRRVQPDLPQLSVDERAVNVVWPSGTTSKFYHIWLRDHCRCPSCFHEQTKQRLVDTFAIPNQIAPQKVEALPEGLVIEWPGESPHTTHFPWDWLRRNAYIGPSNRDGSQLTFRSSGVGAASQSYSKVLWGSSIESAPPQVEFEGVMHSDEALLQWLNKIDQYGFCFVTGVPANPTETEALVRRIAFIRETHYGSFWDFTSDLAHGDTAYTDIALGGHTDTTYFTDPAGLQLFHLLAHTAGGDHTLQGRDLGGQSLLVDGFFAAKLMHDVYPEHYQMLRSTPISTHSAGDSDTLVKPLMRGYPILQHDPVNDDLVMIRYNNSDRSTLRLPEDQVEPFYEALRCWHNILTDKQSEYWFRLRPGTAMIFDNHRVLHGRASFIGSRRLCGAYVPHDDYRSRLSVLRINYESPEGTRSVWEDGV
ncbi:trimethyllysine dioxygenase [Malassezia cuniculi]|uniref:trimethyllysine dioxygenase n=1 Tax=Malassezia cuniculi TaxID=948313 RepID=A0AAF0ERQ7_9BASI|nr:trimethyllysine dioxygenase [Malassezia cuniculi]